MTLLTSLRRMVHGSSTRRAAEEERSTLAAHAAKTRSLPERLAAAFGQRGHDAVLLGRATELRFDVRLSPASLACHQATIGPSGCGKSYYTAAQLAGLIAAGCTSIIHLDPKKESIDLDKRVLARHLRALSPAARRKLLGRLVSFDLFAVDSLPRMNVTALEPGEDPELKAYELSLLLTVDAEAGVRQEGLLHRALECLVRAELPITALAVALENPAIFANLAGRVGPSELFRDTAARLSRESRDRVQGLVARCERLLRLKATRLALAGSPERLDGERLLGLLALVNLAPPPNSGDVSRMIGMLLWNAIHSAIKRRPNGAPRTHVVVDEFPLFLASGGARVADGVEELLRVARSKNAFLTLLQQDFSSLARVSSTLGDVMRNNVAIFNIFRSIADSSWDAMLPIMGTRRKVTAPWEERAVGFLDRSVETALLRDQLRHLPDREMFLADRRNGLPGVRLRTPDLELACTETDLEAVEHAGRSHPLLAPVKELERGLEEQTRRVHALLTSAEARAATDSEAAPLRRSRGKLGIG